MSNSKSFVSAFLQNLKRAHKPHLIVVWMAVGALTFAIVGTAVLTWPIFVGAWFFSGQPVLLGAETDLNGQQEAIVVIAQVAWLIFGIPITWAAVAAWVETGETDE